MAKYRKISPRIWNDAKVRELTDKGKLAFLFMLTHPTMTPFGAIRANIPGLAFELGWTPKAFSKAMQELCANGMATFEEKASLIWFPNFLKYNRPENPNVIKSWAGAFEDLPECALRDAIYKALLRLSECLGKSFTEAFGEAFREGFDEVLPEGFQEAFGEGLPEGYAEGYGNGMPNQEQEQELKAKNTPHLAASGGNAASAQPVADAEKPEQPAPQPAPRKKPKSATPPDEPHYQAKSGRYLTGKRLESFTRFWDAFAFAKGKSEAADAWLNIPELTDRLVDRICDAARQEAQERDRITQKGGTPKWAQGWISGRRWEDYEQTAPKTEIRPTSDPIPRKLTDEEWQKAQEARRKLEAERKQTRQMEPVNHTGDDAQCKLNGLASSLLGNLKAVPA